MKPTRYISLLEKVQRCVNILLVISMLAAMYPAPLMAQAVRSSSEASAETNTISNDTSSIISISRVQSAYTIGDTSNNIVEITFHVSNLKPPTLFPEIANSANLTSTITDLNSFDPTADRNTIRNVIINDRLVAGNLLTYSDPLSLSGDDLIINLGDIPPATTFTATISVDISSLSDGSHSLDTGAQVYGSYQGRVVSDMAVPALLTSNSFSQWLIDTPDADIDDSYMLGSASMIDGTPEGMFASVQALDFESYKGSLRGTRGTLWSKAGNSLDQSSLLIAMLRSSGVPARYVRGTLSDANAQILLLSMFPDSSQRSGVVETGDALSDPVNDPELLAESKDHWWVEAYFSGSWQSLDPSFATAGVNQSFSTISETHAEIPDTQRHKVSVRVLIEEHTSFSGLAGIRPISTPLNETLNAVELAGRPATLYFDVTSSGVGGIFTTITHDYVPILAIAEVNEPILGDTFQELFSTFAGPLSSSLLTAMWIEVETIDPTGNSKSFQREIRDLLGEAARVGHATGEIDLGGNRGDSSQAFISPLDVYQIQAVTHGNTPDSYANAVLSRLNNITPRYGEIAAEYEAIDPNDTETRSVFAAQNYGFLLAYQNDLLSFLSSQYLTRQDANQFDDQFLVKSYPAETQLILQSKLITPETSKSSFELLSMKRKFIPFPGQSLSAARAANLQHSLNSKLTEYNWLAEVFGEQQSGVRTLKTAIDDGIELTTLSAESLAVLNNLTIDEAAKGIIAARLLDGKMILVPTEMVTVDGIETIGWLEIDESGSVSVADENGLYSSASEYATLESKVAWFLLGFLASSIIGGAVYDVFKYLVVAAFGGGGGSGGGGGGGGRSGRAVVPIESQDLLPDIAAASSRASAACSANALLTCTALEILADDLNAATTGLDGVSPLATLLHQQTMTSTSEEFVGTLTKSATIAGSSLIADVETDSAELIAATTLNWQDNSSGLSFTTLSAGSADILQNGVIVDSGPLNAVDGIVRINDATLVDHVTNADGAMSIYSLPLSGLATGSQWHNASTTLTPVSAFKMQMADGVAQIGANVFSENIELDINGSATVEGSGPSIAPAFPSLITANLVDGQINIDSASGAFSINGTSTPVGDRFAVGDFSGQLDISEDVGGKNQLTFSGSADFYSVETTPSTSSAAPGNAALFVADIESNFDDSWNIIINAPAGWDVALDASGSVTIIPPTGTLPDEYPITITAQSTTYPRLFASTIHTITTTPVDQVSLSILADSEVTVPMGNTLNDDNALARGVDPKGQINDGRAEISDAAYIVEITNLTTAARSYDLSVSGGPAGWVILSGESDLDAMIELAAGEVGQIGVYVQSPDVDPPASGTTFNINATVTATDDVLVTDTDSAVFTMPGAAFPFISMEPAVAYAAPGEILTFDVEAKNVGNSAGDFTIATNALANNFFPIHDEGGSLATSPASYTTGSLVVNANDSQSFTVDTTGASYGSGYLVSAESSTPSYTPRTYASIIIVNQNAAEIIEAGNEILTCSENEVLAASFEQLGVALNTLEAACNSGSCNSLQRDAVVTAANSVSSFIKQAYPLVDTAALLTAAATLSTAGDTQSNLDALPAIVTAATGLVAPSCEIAQYQPALSWNTTFDATLTNETMTYTLTLDNIGSLDSTYYLTVTLPSGPFSATPTIAAAGSMTYDFPITVPTAQLVEISAEVTATAAPTASSEALTWLNVVDQYVQTLSVNPSPAFVETGTSQSLINIDVANYANLPIPATAHVELIAADGSLVDSAETDIIIRPGDVLDYDLNTINSSGFASGIYTITVDLRDPDTGVSISDGSGYNFLSIGEGLGVAHFVKPEIVPPGTVTVTTVISTEILGETASPSGSSRSGADPLWEATGIRDYNEVPMALEEGENSAEISTPSNAGSGDGTQRITDVTDDETESPVLPEEIVEPADEGAEPEAETENNQEGETAVEMEDEPVPSGQQVRGRAPTGYTRTENNDAAITYTGTFANRGISPASSANVHRSTQAGDTASFDFSGTWVNVGFLATSYAARAEIFIDGISQGDYDLYRNQSSNVDFVFADLANASHTISITTLATSNPFTSNDYVELDFIDTWDGTILPGGTFEQNDTAMIYSNLWGSRTDGDASGGNYHRATSGSAWFPFYGSSVSWQAFAHYHGGSADIYLDGEFQHRVELFNSSDISRTFSLDGLSNDFHLLTITPRQNYTTIDVLSVPATTAAYSDPIASGYTRYEEDSTILFYDGTTFSEAGYNWDYVANGNASGNYYARTYENGRTISATVTAEYAVLGFVGGDHSGKVELWLDGTSQGVLDLYRQAYEPVVHHFDLTPGSHTISATQISDVNPLSSNDYVYFDFLDVWDGTPLATGSFEQDDDRVLTNGYAWSTRNDALASGGTYADDSLSSVWFPFTGDSVSYQALGRYNMGIADIYLDGEFQHRVDLDAYNTVTQTFALTGLSNDLHVLRVSAHQGLINADRFDTPTSEPAYSPTAQTGVIRVEEYDLGLRYNELPISNTVSSWSYAAATMGSDAVVAASNTSGDTVSYDFTGDWLSLGFFGTRFSGQISITIDSIDHGLIDLYRRADQPVALFYDGLGAGAHSVTVTLMPTSNDSALNTYLNFDYVETWDGSAESDGAFEANFSDPDRIRYSNNWSNLAHASASNGDYIRDDRASVWFHFTGDSVSFEALKYNNGDISDVLIDGEVVATLDLYSQSVTTETFSFDGLGAGPHVIAILTPRGFVGVDRFIAPATTAAWSPPVCGGYCRHEESDPAMRFGGDSYATASDNYLIEQQHIASDSYAARFGTAGSTVSFDFTGTTAIVGFLTRSNGGEANIYIDGNPTPVATVDTYSKDNAIMLTERISGLSAGAHTITIEATGNQHGNSTGSIVTLDYIDVWDGSALPGAAQEVEAVAFTAAGWTTTTNSIASGGDYFHATGNINNRSIWIPFEGDGIQLDIFKTDDYVRTARLWVDGQFVDWVNFWGSEPMTQTLAWDGFGPGAHLLQIQAPQRHPAIDTVTWPATQSTENTAPPTGIVRHEEWALSYNGDSFHQRPASWYTQNTNGAAASSQNAVGTNVANNFASLTFYGPAAQIGFYSGGSTGSAEIFVDGTSHGIFDLSTATGPYTITRISDLITATHTLSVSLISGNMSIDYIDTWDGTTIAEGVVDVWPGDVGSDLTTSFGDFLGFNGTLHDSAIGDRYVSGWFNANHRVWHSFVGDSITYYAFGGKHSNTKADVYIDGVLMETADGNYPFSPTPLAFHYNDLGPGLHEIRIDNNNAMRVDGFETPATNLAHTPLAEWYDFTPVGNNAPFFGSIGMVSGIATGDINNDGIVELVFGSHTYSPAGDFFVYRADGQDSGDGDPIVWSDEWGGPLAHIFGTPAIGNIDGDAESEIIISAGSEIRAYEHDGTVKWPITTLNSADVTSAPALGNLDADPEPEIVINLEDSIAVIEPDGTIAWQSPTTPYWHTAPMLADVNGDTILDIITADWGSEHDAISTTVSAWSYDYGTPTLIWSAEITPSIAVSQTPTFENGLLGSHSIADIDDDGQPEILISHNGWISALNHDGSILWQTELEPGFPGGVSVADIDGDNEVEIITGMRHEFDEGDPLDPNDSRFGKLYALEANGDLKWSVIAEDSTSANNASVLDLNGDGIFEIAWNGKEQGFTIYNGIDGAILFNEPEAFTISGSDYPIIVDVDDDDHAEIIVPTLRGPVVFGMDTVWTEARSIWNQQTYHISNINDDMSIPFSEFNNWDSHNTYHTQYPGNYALPIFGVEISHTVGSDDLAVDSLDPAPDLSDDPTYQWAYVQTVISPTVTRTVTSVLTNLVAGESRLVAEGTTISYTLGSGENVLRLPPLYVNVAHVVALSPLSQTVGAGATATWNMTLTNPTDAAIVYTLEALGLPDGWLSGLPATATVAANSDVAFTLTAATPSAASGEFNLFVGVSGGGIIDNMSATLNVVDALDMAFDQVTQSANPGETGTWILTISNLLGTAQAVDLSASGLPDVTLPVSVTIGANSSITVAVDVKGYAGGLLPFTVIATGENGATDSASAVLSVAASQDVSIALDPDPAVGGPGMPTMVTVTVTNEGSATATYDLSVSVPAGWRYELGMDEVTVLPFVFNSAEIPLILTPPIGTAAATYQYDVTATAQSITRNASEPATTATTGSVIVGNRAVQVAVDPASRTLVPSDSASWTVTVTNTGSVVDTFTLASTGIVALSGSFDNDTVTLNPGASTTVQLSASDFSFALAQTYSFAVLAEATTDSTIVNNALAEIIFNAEEAVSVSYSPATQTTTVGTTVYYLLSITNTGNAETPYDVNLNSAGLENLKVEGAFDTVVVPAHSSVQVLVEAVASVPGAYSFDGSAESASASNSADADLVINVPTQVTALQQGSNQAASYLTIILLTTALLSWFTFSRKRRFHQM